MRHSKRTSDIDPHQPRLEPRDVPIRRPILGRRPIHRTEWANLDHPVGRKHGPWLYSHDRPTTASLQPWSISTALANMARLNSVNADRAGDWILTGTVEASVDGTDAESRRSWPTFASPLSSTPYGHPPSVR